MPTTLVKNAAWAVVWEKDTQQHVYMRNADIAFEGNAISYVGAAYTGTAETVVDGRNLMVMPGLINLHSHPSYETSSRSIREDFGIKTMYMSGFYERMQTFDAADGDNDFFLASSEFAYCELLKSGVTTLLDISPPFPGWMELVAKSGLRAFMAPAYRSAGWRVDDEYDLKYVWNEARGREGFATATRIIDDAVEHPSGRLSGVFSPMQIDTCTPDLLRDSRDAAQERGLPMTVHMSQTVNEVMEMRKRTGLSSIQWASQLGILNPGVILGHSMFVDSNSWTAWWPKIDLATLAQSGATVAHCPTPFARQGHAMETFGSYLRAGVRMGMGTDTAPHNILEEMRLAIILARVMGRDYSEVSTADILNASTATGAQALLRKDIGGIAPGMKADIVLVDLKCSQMVPVYDPLRSLVFHAADRAVRDVYIDGHLVVQNRKVLTLDEADAAQRLTEVQRKMIEAVPSRDYKGRSIDHLCPLCLPMRRH